MALELFDSDAGGRFELDSLSQRERAGAAFDSADSRAGNMEEGGDLGLIEVTFDTVPTEVPPNADVGGGWLWHEGNIADIASEGKKSDMRVYPGVRSAGRRRRRRGVR